MGGRTHSKGYRELTFETPQPKRLVISASEWLAGAGSILWVASHGAVWARSPHVDPPLPPRCVEPGHLFYRVLREPQGKSGDPAAHHSLGELGSEWGRAPRGPLRRRGAGPTRESPRPPGLVKPI